jgi:Domain of unknown function (DUF6471)
MLGHGYHRLRYVYSAHDDTAIIACQDIYIAYNDVYIFNGVSMITDKEWENKAKGLLKAELTRKGVTYQQLAEKLTAMGIPETSENIANKISRGKFTVVFMLQCLEAIGCTTVRLD